MKSDREIMQILEAFDLTGSYRAAGELAGCSHHTVAHYVQVRDEGRDPTVRPARGSVVDPFREKIEEWVERSKGKIRADVAHRKLVAMGYGGSERTTRRAVAEAKDRYARGRRRVFRPWIVEPGMWFQFDWAQGPTVGGRETCLWCAWLAWSRLRVVIPTWDRRLATLLACVDRTLRTFGGAPTYALTDNEKTVTVEHVARIPVRHPEVVAAGRHYGIEVATCVPYDPQTKGGSEATVRVAKADLVPCDANLRVGYGSFAELEVACERFCRRVNARPHRITGRPPTDMLAEERVRLHPIPDSPYVGAFGDTRVVTRSCVITLGNVAYSVPHQLVDEQVWVRVDGDEVVIVHVDDVHGAREVARHRTSTPGNPRINNDHYPHGSRRKVLRRKPAPRTPQEAAFLALGPGAAAWLTKAAAAGSARIGVKMAQAVELADVYGADVVDAALARAAAHGRFAHDDLESIIRHGRDHGRGGGATVTPITQAHSLQTGTSRWAEVGR